MSITPKKRSSIAYPNTDFQALEMDSSMQDPAFLGRSLGRNRKKYVDIRQRPSGRWVAEIKDTIQKIRMWLGTFDTAEDAARAYDEAACLLRGKNTRTNFWPSPSRHTHGTSALPSRTARILLLRLKDANARNKSMGTDSNSNPHMLSNFDDSEPNCLSNYQFLQSKVKVETESLSSDDNVHVKSSKIGLPSCIESNGEVLGSSLTNMPITPINSMGEENFESKDTDPTGFSHDYLEQGQSNSEELKEQSSNALMDTAESSACTDLCSPTGEGLASVESLSGVEKDMIDGLNFVDSGQMITGYCPFEIAAEIAEPTRSDIPSIFMEDLGEYNCSMLRMRSYERKISASLYAMNGISEYFRYTSEPALDVSKDFEAGNGDGMYQSSEQSETCSSACSSDSADGVEMIWNPWNLSCP
ncbi:hypothetical protein SUGI_0206580 [Cryptomeria japonica]|nr:hypothetical protein SUGI_0206580 [Cryptomeria japonica]